MELRKELTLVNVDFENDNKKAKDKAGAKPFGKEYPGYYGSEYSGYDYDGWDAYR